MLNRQIVNSLPPASPTGDSGSSRWNSANGDGQLLQALIISGVITPSMKGPQVQQMYAQFLKYN